MSFTSGGRELRGGVLIMLETHIVMSSLMFCLAFTLMLLLTLSRALPRTSSSASPQFAHGPNHRSYSFGPRENRFEPRILIVSHSLPLWSPSPVIHWNITSSTLRSTPIKSLSILVFVVCNVIETDVCQLPCRVSILSVTALMRCGGWYIDKKATLAP
jgi:hypothetical protein